MQYPGLRRPQLTMEGQCFAFAGPHPNDTDFPSRNSNLFSLQLPVLPSVLGSRRGSSTTSPDIPEPLDFLVEGESQKKSQTDIGLDTSEVVAEKVPEEVQTSPDFTISTCNLRALQACEMFSKPAIRHAAGYTSRDQYLKAMSVIAFVLNAVTL